MSELGDKLKALRKKYIDGGGRLYSAAELCGDLDALETARLVAGDLVVVTFESGHVEDGIVEETTVWVKDATGHSYECRPSQVKRRSDAAKSAD